MYIYIYIPLRKGNTQFSDGYPLREKWIVNDIHNAIYGIAQTYFVGGGIVIRIVWIYDV